MSISPSARQLLAEFDAAGVKAEVVGEVDGLGVYRSVRVSVAGAKKLGIEVFDALAEQPRVAEVVASSKGVRVTVVGDTRADSAEPFGI